MHMSMDERTRFGDRMTRMLNDAALVLMTAIGHRAGLFDAMVGSGWMGAEDLAARAGLNLRYVREWLAAMTTGEIVIHNVERDLYELPEARAAWLARGAGPSNLAGSAQWVSLMGGVEEEVLAAFRHGRGVPYSAYRRFHEVMAEESEQTVVSHLRESILPLVPGLVERLEAGISVLDVGCGAGRAAMRIAELFPRSRVTGVDVSAEAIGLATEAAQRRGLGNVQFVLCDATELHRVGTHDLVTAFDAIHDQARPAEVLRAIRASLRAGGVFLMQEISGSGHLDEDCAHPMGPFLYTISCFHCMSVSLAGGGPGLGAMWGKRRALELLAEAGFGETRVASLDHDPMNFYFVSEVHEGRVAVMRE